MFNAMIETLKANPRKIVFTEGHDARILEATARLVEGGFLTPILVGNVEEVKANAAKGGFNIEGVEILDPATYEGMDAMVEKMVELRKGKMSAEDCRKALSKGNYFGTMLVKMGYADSLLGGATYSTADTVRPALQLVKTKKGAHLVSSCFILVRGEEKLAMGDCAINLSYEDSVDKDGNVTLGGNVVFTGESSFTQVKYSTDKETWVDEWDEAWENTSTEVWAKYSYNAGTTWTSPILVQAKNGEQGPAGSSASVTYANIKAALMRANATESTFITADSAGSPILYGGKIYGAEIYA